MNQEMTWASALAEGNALGEMVEEAAGSLRSQLGDGPIDLLFLFVSPEFQLAFDALPSLIESKLGHRTLIGCSAGGVIGGQRERERKPAVSLLAGRLPGVAIRPFHLEGDRLPDLDASPKAWHDRIGIDPVENPHFVLLPDPLTFDAERLLLGLDFAYPGSVKVGGLASGGDPRSGQPNTLFLNRSAYASGLVGVALSGNVVLETVVAQGCRPIGRPVAVTKADRNVIFGMDKQTPLEHLQEVMHSLTPSDQELARHSLFLGLAMNSFKDRPDQGDFLIRNLMDIDASSGAMAVGAFVREGQTAQFHLRDAKTSAEDLDRMLTRYLAAHDRRGVRGAVLFSCLGRGEYLYGVPDHDTHLFYSRLGVVPMGGFFCNGEIGAVGDATYLHGYTSCFGIFRPKG